MFNFSFLNEDYQSRLDDVKPQEPAGMVLEVYEDIKLSSMLRNLKFTTLIVEDIEDWKDMKKVIESAKSVLQYEQLHGNSYPWIVDFLFDWLSAQKEVSLKSFRVVMGAMLTESRRLFHGFNESLETHLRTKKCFCGWPIQ